MGDFKKIGVWNTAFLGDAVLTLHLIKALNLAYPTAQVHFFVRGGLESLFQAQEGIATCQGFYKRGKQKTLPAARKLGQAIGAQGFDLWISAHTSLRSAVVAASTGTPTRIGYRSPWFNRLAYTHTVDRCFPQLEEVERLMQLTLPLGIHGPAPGPDLLLNGKATLAGVESHRSHRQTPILGVHPGSTWPTKKWPAEYFADIVRRAIDTGWTVAVFAGPGEEKDAAEVIRQSARAGSERIIDLSGRLDLPGLAAHIAAVDLYLTNDSGPMHLAWMQRTPTVALFGPTVRQLGFFPRGEQARVLEVDGLPCRPCGLHGPKACPKGHFKCMLELTPDKVWQQLMPLMALAALPTGPGSQQ